jgi:hypothetical protein
MPLSKEFYLDQIKSKYPNSYNKSLEDLPIQDLEDMLDFLDEALQKADGGSIGIEVLFGPKRDEFQTGGRIGFQGGGMDASKSDFKSPSSRTYSRSYNPGAGGVVQHSSGGSQSNQGGDNKPTFKEKVKSVVTNPVVQLLGGAVLTGGTNLAFPGALEKVNKARMIKNAIDYARYVAPDEAIEGELENIQTEGGISPYANGGRVGLFMGGSPLEGQALNIYNSMNAYGFSDQEIADALSARGLYTPPGSGSTQPEKVTGIINQQIQPSGDNFSPFNPDPNKIKSVRQDPKIQANLEAIQRNQALEAMGIQDPFASEGQPGNEYYDDMMEIDLSPGKQSFFAKAKEGLRGIMDNPIVNLISSSAPFGMVKNIAKGIGEKMPVNERAFAENAAANLGISVDDIGRIVNTGDYLDPNNIMAGYNLNLITPKTFQKRIDRIRRGRLSDEKKAARIKLIQEAQQKIEASQKLARLQAEQANLAKGLAPSGGKFDAGRGGDYTGPGGLGGGQFTDVMGNVDYQDPYDPGGGEKDGGLIGYQKGGLATMFTRRR